MTRLMYCLFATGLMGLLVLGGGCAKKPPAVEHPIVVQAETIQPGVQSASFTYAGDVRGRYESQFAFQASGRIRERLVSNGESVSAGQALMQGFSIQVSQGVVVSRRGVTGSAVLASTTAR